MRGFCANESSGLKRHHRSPHPGKRIRLAISDRSKKIAQTCELDDLIRM